MVSSKSNDDVEGDIRDGYVRSHSISDVSKREHTYDQAIETGTGFPESGPFAFVKSFYEQNEDIINSTATGLASLTSEGRSIESAVSSFSETAKVMIKGLDALAQVHPVVGVAVIAFKAVVTLDMTRRENNKKVLALKIDMQDMMAVLFELRHIRDLREPGPDGTLLGARMQTLMVKFAKDIKEAGSACDAYMKKGFLARTLKSMIYEQKLAEYGATFETNKTELQRALSLHTALGVTAANEKLDSVEVKIGQVLEFFHKLDSPREKDVRKFLEKNGGEKACIESDQLFAELVSKSGETLSDVSGQMRKGEDLGSARKALLKELQEDVDEMFKKNLVIFERKLDMQLMQLQDAIWMSSQYIVTSLRSGWDERILDPEIRSIWKEMGWKGSVKARHFVLALQDHFSDRGPPTVLSEPLNSTFDSPTSTINDRWALAYINVTYVQPIQEAVDDDATGFVSIREVNTFTTSAPHDWSLLQRLAYWAAGWHISISSYKEKIYGQFRKMMKLRNRVPAANRRLIDEYLTSFPTVAVEHILRSIRSRPNPHDTELGKLVERFDREEEERLAQNLTRIAYDIDTVETIGLVTGPGRIERYLLPLIHALLERDLRVMKAACKCIIHEDELSRGARALRLISLVVEERIERIAGIFKQFHPDMSVRLGIYAFGMFQIYYEKLYEDTIIPLPLVEELYLRLLDESSNTDEEDEALQDEIDSVAITDLKLQPFDFNVIEDGFLKPSSPSIAEIPEDSTLSGYWSGHLWDTRTDSSHLGLTEWQIHPPSDGRFAATGQCFYSSLTMDGTLDVSNNVEFHLKTHSGYTMVCEGKFDPNRQRIEASWKPKASNEESPSGDILFWRTPTPLYRFRYTIADFEKNAAQARWAFVREAVLCQVRRKSWSWSYFKARINEAKRLLTLSIGRSLERRHLAPNKRITQDEINELRALWTDVDPRLTRMCLVLADFHIDRLLVHHQDVFCDSCRRTIYETRITCLVCIAKDFTNHIDLCRPCLTLSPDHKVFNHNPSHSMIKYEYVVHHYDEVLASRDVAARAKMALKVAEEGANGDTIQQEGTPATAATSSSLITVIACLCCSKPVTIPCWMCRFCTPDTFICSDCEEKRVTPPENHTHKLSHPLVRIASTDPDPRPYDEPTVEARLAALEKRVDERTNELEIRVQERLNRLETKMQDQFSILETLLRQIVAQSAGVTSIN